MREPVIRRGASPVAYSRPDRWAWRVKMKSNPTTYLLFRFLVGFIGVTLIIAAPLTGWLPGPGGIPLFLLGLAVLGTEFHWARRFRKRLMHYLRVYLNWSVNQQRLFWLVTFLTLGLFWWIWMVLAGIPPWLPGWAKDWLQLLPGVE